MDNPWYFIVGFAAQLLFSARVVIQWLLSEKAKKIVAPTIYWQISLLAAFLFSIYGWLRGDFAIILGQFFTYYIYIWNLKTKGYWGKIYPVARIIILLVPIVSLTYVLVDGADTIDRLFCPENIPLSLLLFGSIGQVIFTLRFIYQWQYSHARNQSVLPKGFWILSLVGAAIVIVYGILRKDPVLIIGHGVGFIIYVRNLWIAKTEK